MNALATSVNFVLRACCPSCTFAILLPLPKLPILEGTQKTKWLQRRALLDLWPRRNEEAGGSNPLSSTISRCIASDTSSNI